MTATISSLSSLDSRAETSMGENSMSWLQEFCTECGWEISRLCFASFEGSDRCRLYATNEPRLGAGGSRTYCLKPLPVAQCYMTEMCSECVSGGISEYYGDFSLAGNHSNQQKEICCSGSARLFDFRICLRNFF